uniref:SH3 domain-containing protein n=1 Tax=Periophthalmus magnuspinnatus TaxID=409849 RepID=A0A3B4AXM2_9GOBI
RVKYKESMKKDCSNALYHTLPETLETQRVKEITQLQSQQFNREKGRSSYSRLQSPPQVQHALQVSKNQSQVRRTDLPITHVSHLCFVMFSSTGEVQSGYVIVIVAQVKYREGLEELRGHKPCYNPLECVSFKHTQAAGALASQYKSSQRIESGCDVPNLLQLQHVLHASKLQSNVEYKRQYEQNKAQYHMVLDTAEQRHHKDNAVLHSQVKYKEEYEKNKGRSQMEFSDTEAYKVSREAQRMTSEVRGAKDDLLDYIKMCLYSVNLSLFYVQKEYRKDLEEVRGRGLSGAGLEETPDLLRAKNATNILSEKKYRDKAERLRSSYSLVPDTPEMERVRNNQKQLSSVSPVKLNLRHLSTVKTPETVLARENSKKISDVSVHYKEEVGRGTPVTETPELERVRRNQDNISNVKYRSGLQELKGRSLTHLDTPEYRRVRRSQDAVSMAKYHEDFDRSRGRGSALGLDEPGMERYHRANQMIGEAGFSRGTHSQSVDMDRRPGAPVLPGAYQQVAQQQQYGYMHQTSLSSVRSVTSPPHAPNTRVYRALYDYAAQDHDEVSFKDGDVIVNAQHIDEGWICCVVVG